MVSLVYCWIPRAMPGTCVDVDGGVVLFLPERVRMSEAGITVSAVLAQLLLPGLGKESALKGAWNREGRALGTQQERAKGRSLELNQCGSESGDGRKGWLTCG